MQKNWDSATSTLIGNGLSIVRVTQNDQGAVTIIWRQPPTDEEKEKANALIGAAAHAW